MRFGMLALGCLALANCSAAEKFARKDTKTQRIAEDAEIAKGGGHRKIGKPYMINGQIYAPADEPDYRAEGIASWYGPDFHGRLTANGETYNMHGYSAAHPTLPLPSYARVTNLRNGKSIIVRVNNRGPFVHNRLVDLSVGTAKALDFYGRGLARVRFEYVGRAPIEGSDDRMLLATLRDGSPAPAPSQVMVASAKPFVPAANHHAIAGRTAVCARDHDAARGAAIGIGRIEAGRAGSSRQGRRPSRPRERYADRGFRPAGRSVDRPGSHHEFCTDTNRRGRNDERPRALLTGRKIDAPAALIPQPDAC